MKLVIGLDLGTTNCKAVAVTPEGQSRASASSEYRLRSPHPGWAEEQVEDVWQGVLSSLKELAGKINTDDVVGICLSGAMHSLFPVGEEDQPLAPAMTWADQRAAPQAQKLHEQADAHALYTTTGCPLQAIYHPAKLRWWLEERPDLSNQAGRFSAIKDWVLHRLAGRWVIDYGLASTTGLMDTHELRWHEQALSLAGVDAERLPELVSPQEVVGELRSEVARQTGLPAGIPVVAGTTDGGLANLGAGAAQDGQSVITVGTSGAVRRVVAQPLLDEHERTWCYVLVEDRWFAGGAINNGGLTMQWGREHLYPDLEGDQGYQRMGNDAAGVPPGSEGLLVLPYFTGERSPHWDAGIRAHFSGLGLEHTRAHMARALLEGVAFCLADVWEALSSEGEFKLPVHITGGITRTPVWVQIVADVLGVPLARVEAADASAVGAAMLGHHVLTDAGSLEDLAAQIEEQKVYQPDERRHKVYVERHQAFQELYRKLQG